MTKYMLERLAKGAYAIALTLIVCGVSVPPASGQAVSSKKGVALGASIPDDADADANGNYATKKTADLLNQLGVRWYYNYNPTSPLWSANQKSKSANPPQFFPMIWDLDSFSGASPLNPTPHYVLGFNEPDGNTSAQSNITPQDAADHWPQVTQFALHAVSPAMAGNPDPAQSWMHQFFDDLGDTPEPDTIAVHFYNHDASQLKLFLQNVYNMYVNNPNSTHPAKKVWLTEFACNMHWEANDNDPTNDCTQAQVYAYMDLIPWMENQTWLVRYAWHDAGKGTSRLVVGTNEPGKNWVLSCTGKAYANPSNYDKNCVDGQ